MNRKEEVINKYFYFINNTDDSLSYSIINNSQDAKKIIERSGKKRESYISDLVISDYSIFDKQDELIKKTNFRSIYYWAENRGVILFDFNFDQNNLLNEVNCTRIGYLGNEFIPL